MCLGYLGFLSSGLGYLFWNAAVKELGPSAAAAFLYLEPLAALAAGRLMLGESIAASAVLGGALILVGVYWINVGRRLPAAPEEAA
jgi:drug/metabolite transporter (DMT)-like permease